MADFENTGTRMRFTKKKPYTDIATEAFRFYFSHPDYITEIMSRPSGTYNDRCNASGIADPTAAALLYKEYARENYAANITAWNAAHKAICALERDAAGTDKVKVLRAAYDSPHYSGIEGRVRWASISIHISEATAWRWLAQACRYWAEIRGVILRY